MGHDPNYQHPHLHQPSYPPQAPQQATHSPVIVNVSQQVNQGFYWATAGPNPGTAALVEFLGGFFCGTFGLGHIYGGHVLFGVLVLFGNWLCVAMLASTLFIGIGFVLLPMYWLAMLIFSPLIAYNGAGKSSYAGPVLIGFGVLGAAFAFVALGAVVLMVAMGGMLVAGGAAVAAADAENARRSAAAANSATADPAMIEAVPVIVEDPIMLVEPSTAAAAPVVPIDLEGASIASPQSQPANAPARVEPVEKFRLWKSDIGTEIRAKFVERTTTPDGNLAVRLERPDGTIATVPLDRLSLDDQNFALAK